MSKKYVFYFIGLLVLIQLFSYPVLGEKVSGDISSTEQINEFARIITIKTQTNISVPYLIYTKNNEGFESVFDNLSRFSFDWIKDNLPSDAVITAWWDEGHSIRGYTNKEVIIYAPSKKILFSLVSMDWDEKGGKLSDDTAVKDVAKILATPNPKEASKLMRKYKSDYIYISGADVRRSWTYYTLSQIPCYNAIRVGEHEYKYDESGMYCVNLNSSFMKMYNREDIDGFELIYHNISQPSGYKSADADYSPYYDEVVIYKMKRSMWVQISLAVLLILIITGILIYVKSKKVKSKKKK